MKPTQLIFTAIVIVLVSCKGKDNRETQQAETKISDSTKNYLPVADFIREDMRRVDSFASGILKRTSINGKRDSAYIQLDAFNKIAAQFLPADLDSPGFQEKFSESSVVDQSTHLLNFIYSARDAGKTLHKVIIYIAPGPVTDKVDLVYMEKEFIQGDTLVQQKFTWKMKHFFYILTFRRPKTGNPSTMMDKIIWEPQEFHED